MKPSLIIEINMGTSPVGSMDGLQHVLLPVCFPAGFLPHIILQKHELDGLKVFFSLSRVEDTRATEVFHIVLH